RVFRQGLLLHHGRRYRLMAWCIMPNHVHVLIECRYSLARIVQSWKSYSARWAVEHNERLGLGLQGGRVWMRGYWDRYIRDERHLAAAVHYIHSNPVTAGRVERAGDWQWSSAGRDLDLLRGKGVGGKRSPRHRAGAPRSQGGRHSPGARRCRGGGGVGVSG